jgi:phage baseplate assembly protein W
MEYLTLPFILRDGYLARGTLRESIDHSIGLILSSRIGVMPFNREYGCDIWDKEYSDLYTANKAEIRASLRNAVDKLERRLYNVSVSFMNVSEESPHLLGMAVKVSGNYRDGAEEMKYESTFYLG